MARASVPVPVVSRPAQHGEEAARVVPHYANNVDPGADLVAWGLEARLPRAHEQPGMPTEWVEAPVWTGMLSVTGYHGGRSSSCYVVRIETGILYTAATAPRGQFDPALVGTLIPDGKAPVVGMMSCLVFRGVIPGLRDGQVFGTWGARKQGQNYMIQPA